MYQLPGQVDRVLQLAAELGILGGSELTAFSFADRVFLPAQTHSARCEARAGNGEIVVAYIVDQQLFIKGKWTPSSIGSSRLVQDLSIWERPQCNDSHTYVMLNRFSRF